MEITDRERNFMQMAIAESRLGMDSGHGGPFGCVIVKGNDVVGRGHNCVTSTHDPTAHAEVTAIRDACKKLNTFQLTGCELYTSCEPCPMCLGAIYWARPDKTFFANTKQDAAAVGFDDQFIYDEIALPIPERKMKMTVIPMPEAKQVFDDWVAKLDKIAY
jgi:guanine deaminase